MKINRIQLLKFLRTINVSTMDKNSVNSVCIKWDNGKLKCNGLNSSQTLFVGISENFNIEEISNMYLHNLDVFINFLNGFKSEDILLTISENAIILSDTILTVSYISGNAESIIDKAPKISIDFSANVVCDLDLVDNLLKACSIIKEDIIYVNIIDSIAQFTIGNKNIGSNFVTFKHPAKSSENIKCAFDAKLLLELIKKTSHYINRTLYFESNGKLKLECTKNNGAVIYITQGQIDA